MATDDDDEPTLKLDWVASHRRDPSGDLDLVVEGTGMAPTPGWEAELVRANPQGTNPKILLLRFIEHRSSGPQPEVLTPITVTYIERVESEDQLDAVDIVGITLLHL
jgi:hypothetical protein